MIKKTTRICKDCRDSYKRYETDRGYRPHYCPFCYARRLTRAAYRGAIKRLIGKIDKMFPELDQHVEWKKLRDYYERGIYEKGVLKDGKTLGNLQNMRKQCNTAIWGFMQ